MLVYLCWLLLQAWAWSRDRRWVSCSLAGQGWWPRLPHATWPSCKHTIAGQSCTVMQVALSIVPHTSDNISSELVVAAIQYDTATVAWQQQWTQFIYCIECDESNHTTQSIQQLNMARFAVFSVLCGSHVELGSSDITCCRKVWLAVKPEAGMQAPYCCVNDNMLCCHLLTWGTHTYNAAWVATYCVWPKYVWHVGAMALFFIIILL